MEKMVDFQSEGVTLRGRLYTHPGASNPTPIVIMAHGFSATINGMVAEQFAEIFHAGGLTVLLYDHYSLGISDGEPRLQFNRWVQTRGYLDAIAFAITLPGIDAERIVLWGDSMSGAEVIVAGAVDPRVKAIVAQVPACGREHAPPDPEGSMFAQMRDILLEGDLASFPQTTRGPLPVVSADQKNQPSLLTPLTAFRWFIEYGGRYGTNWENWGTVVTPETSVPFHAGFCAPHLRSALQMMVAYEDEMPGANSNVARAIYELAPQPKELVEIDGGHFGLLYYPGPLFDQASKVQLNFLKNNL